MLKPVVILAGGVLVLALAVGFARSTDAETPTATQLSASGSQISSTSAVVTGDGLDPATVRQLGAFRTSKGYTIDMTEGDFASAAPTVSKAGAPVHPSGPQRCVRTDGGGFAATVCGMKPLFERSNVLFGESASGGTSAEDRTEYFISGIVSPRVSRIDAVLSDGSVLPAQLGATRAFFVELTATQLANGLTIKELTVYGRQDSVIQRVNL